ncbi:ABC transporter substrate-binding protein [Actinobacteria bacterium YIM 96077]|uniref:ABC transporter substrate-binding protein n=1 Tax=Phytoactinopolyspora halophila TaxID=1981511 RepID=A0A329QDC2_9ACTN|nr:ABC transporter substrate-binding protein [Phytoactinopolyspora halophila]AYY14033.1 ABC transporter substrate-binding protein [Actinobacteria bacterium YIM 96077]RAW10284.1 ABC transporter substrate-binding protein [Phytoactinopolyspora halophila]
MNHQRPTSPLLSRRRLLYGGGLVVVSAAASGCGFFETDPGGEGDGADPSVDKGPEAPMLAEQVDAGDLPPVDERLPVNPLVVEPTERIGTYGGTWRTAVTGEGDGPWMHRTIGYESLLRWTRDWDEPILNVAESFEVSDDGREFTIRLREGHRWSDGEPLTTEDVQFAFDILTNRDINQSVHSMLQHEGEIAELDILDDYTFVVRFASPHGLWRINNANVVDGDRLISFPKHYLENFLPENNPDIEDEAREAGFESWQEYFNSIGNGFSVTWNNLDLPTLNPFIVVEPLQGATDRALFRRNPYYFKVDPDGSQLPYLDEVRYDIIADEEAMLLRATNGEFDLHTRHFNTLENRPVVAENQEDGNYRILELDSTWHNQMTIMLNLHHRDEAVRELYQDRNFRIALSHAIDRQRLVDAVWNRQGEPYQAAPVPGSEFYDEEFATQYLEHDPDLANEILDDAGYDERDGDGYRLRADGGRLSVRVSIADPGPVDGWVQAMELVADDWEQIGVECTLDPKPREAFETEKSERDHDATVWVGEGGHNDALILPRQYFAFDFESHFGNSWATVWEGGEFDDPDDVPPPMPEPMAEQQRLYDELTAEPDEAARNEIFQEILEIAKEQFWCIGTVRLEGTYGIVHDRFQNVGGPMPESSVLNTPAPANAEQFFVDEDA